MAKNEVTFDGVELLAYDMVNGFTYIGERNVSSGELEKYCTIPTANLMKTTSNGNGPQLLDGAYTNAYQHNAIELYSKSQKDTKPVKINPDNVCMTHHIKYTPQK